MNLSTRLRARYAVIFIAAALASTIGFGPAAVAGQEPLPEACALQERSPNGIRAVDLSCESDEYVTCSYYEDVHGRIRVVYGPDQYCPSYAAVEEARIEAAGWPDYDSTAISDAERNIAIDRATREAASWPNYDSTAISNAERNIAIDRATREAAGWPDYDSTAISSGASTDTASNSPRMTQIAAEAASEDGAEVASGYDAPVAQSPHQTAF